MTIVHIKQLHTSRYQLAYLHAVEMELVSCSAFYCQPLAHWAKGGSFERSFDTLLEKADVRLRGS